MSTFDAWALPGGVSPPGATDLDVGTDGWAARRTEVDGSLLGDLAEDLRDQARRLRAVPAVEIVDALGAVGERFLDPDDTLRIQALKHLGPSSGLSPEMAAAVLDGMAVDWSGPRLAELVRRELGGPEVLDGFVQRDDSRVKVLGPALCVQVISGSVPGVGATALLRSLLVKAPTLLKPGRGDIVLPVLMARALAEVDARLAEALAVVYWPGGDPDAEGAVLHHADVVVAYGGDEAARELRARTPVTARFVAYHHRVSLGVVGREALDGDDAHRVASEVAGAVAFFDQRGCVSPHVVFVEEGGEVGPSEFAGKLAAAMGVLEDHLPTGSLDNAEASAVHQMRGAAEMRAASGAGVEIHQNEHSWWTVILDPEATLDGLCVGRTVRVRPVADVMRVPELIASRERHLQTVGLEGCGSRSEALAAALAEVGASRVTSFAQVPFPPAWWHHDGQGALAPLVRWIDFE